jgi:phosphoribosylcarboxyaminoimidazole (NCAIR) mutase
VKLLYRNHNGTAICACTTALLHVFGMQQAVARARVLAVQSTGQLHVDAASRIQSNLQPVEVPVAAVQCHQSKNQCLLAVACCCFCCSPDSSSFSCCSF